MILATIAALSLVPHLATAEPLSKGAEFCRSGHQVRKLAVFYTQRMPKPAPGVPLDQALEREQRWVDQVRNSARRYFYLQPTKPLERLMDDYTFLLPEAVREKVGIGDLIGASEISTALRYHNLLWKQYIEKFTSVQEAPSDDPYVLRFEVSLDLNFFCAYGQRVSDLVTSE